jgi:cell division protein FtsI/penicillin-binding protein 2
MNRELGRFGLVLAGIGILYAFLAVKLFYWQVLSSEYLKNLGRLQSSEIIEVPAMRGEIKASDNFPLATNKISYSLYSNPKAIDDKNSYAEKIAPIIGQTVASVSANLSRDLYFARLARGLDSAKKREIEKLNLKNLGFEEEYSRFYPEASMAAHLVGFVGKDEKGENKGYFGIEGEYNNQLSGRSGAKYILRDALGNPIIGDEREDLKIDGRNIKLTVDRTIQYSADLRLAEGIKKYDADGGSVIVMETKTGAILAMNSHPKFDPKNYYEFDGSTYKNPVLSDLYEPGSTFKVLVMAMALDLGLATPETKCDICGGPIQIGEYKIKTWNDKYFPNSTMNDVIVHSDNTGMVFVGKKIGVKNLISYFSRFGIGEPTGIDLQGENTGVIRDENSWYPIDLATASFGQGISLTPIQLVTAVNSIAAGGRLMRPYVVSEIQTDEGKTIPIKPKDQGKTVSKAAAQAVTSMMVNAVESGEAKWTKIKNYKIAGKTGTAQIPVAGHYDPNHTIASFVGFFPPKNPKVTMLVLVDHPRTSIYGSETAAPIFFNIARDIIKYYDLPAE